MVKAPRFRLWVFSKGTNMRNLCRLLLVILIAQAIIFFAYSPCAAQQKTNSVLDVGSFYIAMPNTSDWSITVDESKSRIEAVRPKKWWTGRILGSTLISVFENRVMDETKRSGSQDELAKQYIASEENILITAAQDGNYTVETTARGTADIGGKKFYTLAYKIKRGRFFLSGGMPQIVEAILYVWLPQGFSQTGKFYGFLISESYERGALIKVDLEQILPVIESFSLKP